MKHLDSFLEETLEAWWDARQGIIEELRNIPAGKLGFRPAGIIKVFLPASALIQEHYAKVIAFSR